MRFILLLFTFLSLNYCEDKQKSSQKIEKKKTSKKTKFKIIQENDSVKLKKKSTKLNDKNAMDFFLEYEKKNKENTIIISTDFGDIEILLFEKTKFHRANFIFLTKQKYFNNTQFYRVINNFIIQGGDPTETGRGTAGYRFGDEFTKDVNGKLLHIHGDAGMLSMANRGPESNGSQFFITHRAIPHLDGKHTVFGKTVVNSLQLNTLKLQIKDSLKRKNAIDSLRMSVVNSIQQFDTIFTVKIIRIGAVANAFKAGEVFDNEFIVLFSVN